MKTEAAVVSETSVSAGAASIITPCGSNCFALTCFGFLKVHTTPKNTVFNAPSICFTVGVHQPWNIAQMVMPHETKINRLHVVRAERNILHWLLYIVYTRQE